MGSNLSCARAQDTYYVGVEIGGTKQQIAVGNIDADILERREVKLGTHTDASAILQWIEETILSLRTSRKIAGIGVGFGGPVDFSTGKILCSLQVDGWKDFALKSWFENTFQLPTAVLNDTVVGGLGELYRGVGQGSQRFFYTNIGTGIGGGLYWPDGFGASSLGYAWVPDWQSSQAGAATRLEYLCAGPFIERRLNTPGYIPPDSELSKKKSPLTCIDLAEGARQGDSFCCAELDRIASSFSLGLADVLALAFPERIVIGGGVAKMGEVLFSRLRSFTEKFAFVADIGRYEILPSSLMDDAVLVGALFMAANPTILTK